VAGRVTDARGGSLLVDLRPVVLETAANLPLILLIVDVRDLADLWDSRHDSTGCGGVAGDPSTNRTERLLRFGESDRDGLQDTVVEEADDSGHEGSRVALTMLDQVTL
jgi:hypothetical protein